MELFIQKGKQLDIFKAGALSCEAVFHSNEFTSILGSDAASQRFVLVSHLTVRQVAAGCKTFTSAARLSLRHNIDAVTLADVVQVSNVTEQPQFCWDFTTFLLCASANPKSDLQVIFTNPPHGAMIKLGGTS